MASSVLMTTNDDEVRKPGRWKASASNRRCKVIDPDPNEFVRALRLGLVTLCSRRLERAQYAELVESMAKELEAIALSARELAINLACTGKWRRWEETLSPRASVRFADGPLMRTGDARVTALMELFFHAATVGELFGGPKAPEPP